ncbi:MAG: hypothetical protein MSA09_02095 [Lachnospiraceae bacterium]|nr:hypothetical protein [Lachnospiraceae bacterium]MDD7176992.1 hypothetical protein [bacterium]MDY5517500.1 hypothetical protein [Lachnospiraceae bacterium]
MSRVTALKANVFPEDRERAKVVDMDEYLTKPVVICELIGELAGIIVK